MLYSQMHRNDFADRRNFDLPPNTSTARSPSNLNHSTRSTRTSSGSKCASNANKLPKNTTTYVSKPFDFINPEHFLGIRCKNESKRSNPFAPNFSGEHKRYRDHLGLGYIPLSAHSFLPASLFGTNRTGALGPTDERLKNISPHMVEMIKNEIMHDIPTVGKI